jgi:hypothetical protein
MICFFIILLVCDKSDAAAQSNYSSDTCKISTTNSLNREAYFNNPAQTQYLIKLVTVLPANQYLKKLGFFCKRELEIEKATKLPLRFRLGSVAYTDRMENKNNFRPADSFKN